jgi:hypothetical protein
MGIARIAEVFLIALALPCIQGPSTDASDRNAATDHGVRLPVLRADTLFWVARGSGRGKIGYVGPNPDSGEPLTARAFAISPAHNVGIVDAAHKRITEFTIGGRVRRLIWATADPVEVPCGLWYAPDGSLVVESNKRIVWQARDGKTTRVVRRAKIGGPSVKGEPFGNSYVRTDERGRIYWIEWDANGHGSTSLARCDDRGQHVQRWPGIEDFAFGRDGTLHVVATATARLPDKAVRVQTEDIPGFFRLIGANEDGVWFQWMLTDGAGIGVIRPDGSSVRWSEADLMWADGRIEEVGEVSTGNGYWITDYHMGPDGQLYALAVAPKLKRRYVGVLHLSVAVTHP